LRRMEAAALTCDDVDLVAGTIRVTEGKGGKGRIVHIQPPLAPVLRWYVHDVRPQAGCGWRVPWVFFNASQRRLHPDGIRNILHRQQVQAGLAEEDYFSCHGFRRAFATRLYKALREQRFRDPLMYVKEQLGHVYVSTTQRYCQLDDDYRHFLVKEAGEALAQHYGSGQPGASR
jgi:integrase/recombinase XerD